VKSRIMKKKILFIAIIYVSGLISCKKDAVNQEIIPIPNGDFELWDTMPTLLLWQTNSCPLCDPPFETYIVQKVTDSFSGQFAAKLIYNNVYSSYVNNKFSISTHPTILRGYIKSTIASGDTALIHIDLFIGKNIVDTGIWYETLSTSDYKKIEIPISQNSSSSDSALVRIVGGKKENTILFVDNFEFVKTPE
jgi:hypothetical protein